jgi:hypothetical protein
MVCPLVLMITMGKFDEVKFCAVHSTDINKPHTAVNIFLAGITFVLGIRIKHR